MFSAKDEKQRIIAYEITQGIIKPELKLKISMNNSALERKKIVSSSDPETYRVAVRMSSFGKDGWYYLMTSSNVSRFGMSLMVFLFYYNVG